MPTMVEIAPQVIPILDRAGQYRSLCGEALPDLADSLRRALATYIPAANLPELRCRSRKGATQ
jgi:hypothetical protein